MRILVVSHYFEDHGGGIEIVAARLAKELAGLGHSVTWAATAARLPEGELPGVERLRLVAWNGIERATGLPMPILSPAAAIRLARGVRAADAVLIHDALYLPSLVALATARHHRLPTVVVQHIGAIAYRSSLLRAAFRAADRLIVRPTLARADQTVFISATVRAFFSLVPFRRPPLLLFNGVDTELFNLAPTDLRSRLRAEFELPEGCTAALFVGRFVEKKGLVHIREAARQSPETEFLMVGSGPVDPSRWALPNVRVLGSRPATEVAKLYLACDALVLPSIGEGLPLVLQEALACGLPVICGEETAQADPEATPLLNPIALDSGPAIVGERIARALNALHCGGPDSSRRSAFARARYSWAETGRRYAELLLDLVQHAPRSGSRCALEARPT